MMATIDPMMGTPHWALWLLLGLGTIGFWSVVAYVTGSLFDQGLKKSDRPTSERADLDVQLARGQIDVDEYQLRRRQQAGGR